MEEVDWATLTATASATFDPVPAGVYNAEVIEAKPDKSSGGKLMFAVKFNVLDGPHAGRKLWNNFTLSPENPNALGYFFKHMEALGLPKSWFAQQPSKEAVAQALVGRRAILKVSVREWNGSMRNDINDVIPASGTAPGPALQFGAAPAPVPVTMTNNAGFNQTTSVTPPPPAPAPAPVAPPPPPPAPAAPAPVAPVASAAPPPPAAPSAPQPTSPF